MQWYAFTHQTWSSPTTVTHPISLIPKHVAKMDVTFILAKKTPTRPLSIMELFSPSENIAKCDVISRRGGNWRPIWKIKSQPYLFVMPYNKWATRNRQPLSKQTTPPLAASQMRPSVRNAPNLSTCAQRLCVARPLPRVMSPLTNKLSRISYQTPPGIPSPWNAVHLLPTQYPHLQIKIAQLDHFQGCVDPSPWIQVPKGNPDNKGNLDAG